MLRSRRIMQAARTLTACLIAVLVCPPLGQVGALVLRRSNSCSSAHACCRARGNGMCPHQMPGAGEVAHCHGAVCVLTCNDHTSAPSIPVVMIGFAITSAAGTLHLAAAPLSDHSHRRAVSKTVCPLTPPPRTLTAA